MSTANNRAFPRLARGLKRSALLGLFVVFAGCGLGMSPDERLERGEAAYASGDIRAAIIDAKDVLLKEPDNRRARILLGRASVAGGDGVSGEKEFQRALELGATLEEISADLAAAFLLQGKYDLVLSRVPLDAARTSSDRLRLSQHHADAHAALGNTQVARDLYTSILEVEPDNLSAAAGVASSFITEGNLQQASQSIDHLLGNHAENPKAWLFAGGFHQQYGDPGRAVESYRVALERASEAGSTPDRIDALGGVARSLYAVSEFEAANEYIEQLVALAPDGAETRLLTAQRAVHNRDWVLAQQELLAILSRVPDYRPAQLMLGTVHMESGNLAQAEMYLKAAVTADPRDTDARRLLAATQLQMRKSGDAQAALAPIVGRPDADQLSLQMAAQASLARQETEDAVEYLRRSIDQDPDDENLRFQLAVVLIQSGQSREAQSILDGIDLTGSSEGEYSRDVLSALNRLAAGDLGEASARADALALKYPDRFGVFNLLGAVAIAKGDDETAKSYYESAERLNPDDVVSRRILATMDMESGNLEAAENRLRGITEDYPEASQVRYMLGRIHFAQGRFQTAAAEFRAALAGDPGNVDYRHALAKSVWKSGDSREAVELLQDDSFEVLEHIPSTITLGMILAEQGDVSEARALATELQDAFPDDPAPVAFEGELYLVEDDLISADRAYERALSIELGRTFAIRSHQIKRNQKLATADEPLLRYLQERPLDNGVRTLLAQHYLHSGDHVKSIAAYERVVADQPDDVVALNNLAWSYHLNGDPRAVDAGRRALAQGPDNPAVLDTVGWILVAQGELDEAERLLRKATATSGHSPDTRYHLAVVLTKTGRVDEARRTLEELLASSDAFASQSEAEALLAEL